MLINIDDGSNLQEIQGKKFIIFNPIISFIDYHP